MLYNVTKVYVLNNQVLYVDEGEISRDSSNFNQIDVITNVSGFGVEIAFKLPNGVFSDRIGLIQQTGTVTVPSGITELQSVAGESWSTYTTLIDNAVLSAITSTTSQSLGFSIRFSNQITNLLVFDELADFPTTGEGDKVYQSDNNKVFYIWNGTSYVTRTTQQANALIITQGQVYTTEPTFIAMQGTIDGDPLALDPAFYQTQIVSSFNNLVALYNSINGAITDSATGLPAIAGKVAKAGDTMTGQLQFSNAAATRLVMGNNNVTTDAGINATTFKNGDLTSDAIKFSNLAQLFAVTAATPTGGQTWIDTFTAALAAKFAGILSEAELNAIYFRRDGTVSMSGNLNVGGNQITNVGNVDGVDISSFKSTTDNHISATNNPHSVTAAQTGAYTTGETDNLLDGKAAASHTHPISEVTNLQTTLNTLSNNISALSGAFIFRGVVSNTTAQVTADTGLLTTRIVELLTRQPQTGDVLKDTDGGEWYYDGGAWRFVGQSFVDLTPYLTTDNANNTFETITNIGNRTYDENNVVVDAESVTSSINRLDIEIETKVDKEEGKGLSANDFTTTLKDKLDGIAAGAEVNVQANWTEANSESDAFILNKPNTFPPSSHTHAISEVTNLETELSGKEPTFTKNTAFNKNFGNTAETVTEGNDARLSDARTPLSHTHAISEVTNLQTALDSKPTIDAQTGKIPASVIPLQFEDVIQGYLDDGVFYEEVGLETAITGEEGKLYIDITTNTLYRFDGAAYVLIIDAAEITSLNDIPDVVITSVANDEALVYNTATSKWENKAIPRSIADQSDTTITSATNGQVLTWNGTAWVNAAIPTQDLDDLDDVVITSPVANHLLVHNGTNFVNQAGTSTLVGLNNVQNYGIASQSEAELGTSDEKYMTPLKTAQAIAELAEHENITAATSVDNSGNNVIQDVTLDSNGHVTGLVSKEITSVANATVADTVDNANSANNLTFWTGTQAEYDNLTPDANTLYFVTE